MSTPSIGGIISVPNNMLLYGVDAESHDEIFIAVKLIYDIYVQYLCDTEMYNATNIKKTVCIRNDLCQLSIT